MSADNYGVLNPIRKWNKCNDCGLVYAHNIPSSSALSDYYKFHSEALINKGVNAAISQVGNIERYITYSNNRLDKIESLISKKGKLLDIGAGIGTFVKVARDRGWDVYGIESSQNDYKYAKEYWDIDLIDIDFSDFSSNQSYDIITMFEVIEHFVRPWDALEKCSKLLSNGGILLVATLFRDSDYVKSLSPEQDFWWNEPSHLSYMDTECLIKRAKLYGFECIKIVDSEQGAGMLEIFFRKQ